MFFHLYFVFTLVYIFRSVCSSIPDTSKDPLIQSVSGAHLLPHGVAEVCGQTSCSSAAGALCFFVSVHSPGCPYCICFCFQGFSFLWRYVELRGECQESMYNLGRALHQMSLTHLAIHYYQKALSLPPEKLEVHTQHILHALDNFTSILHFSSWIFTFCTSFLI